MPNVNLPIQGFGSSTTGGGSDPTIVPITNLNDSGTGSLRAFLEDAGGWGPRAADIRVSGIIDLRTEIRVQGNVTYDGVATDQYLTYRGNRIRVIDDNVIIRGIRPLIGRGGSDPGNGDGISIGFQPTPVSRVVIDRCTLGMSTDEVMTSWGRNDLITISNCIIGPALKNAGNPKGPHGMGLLGGARQGATPPEFLSRMTVHSCLLYGNDFRNPMFKDGAQQVEFFNNIMLLMGNAGAEIYGAQVDFINNVYRRVAGTTSQARIFLNLNNASANEIYMSGNTELLNGSFIPIVPQTNTGVNMPVPRFTGSGATVLPGGQNTIDHVLFNAGAELDGNFEFLVKYHFVRGFGAIIDRPGEMRDHNNQQIGTDAQFYSYQFPAGLAPVVYAEPTGPQPIIVNKGDGNPATPLVVTTAAHGIDPAKSYRITMQRANTRGPGAPSSPAVIASPLAPAVSGTPTVFGSSGNSQWRYNDIEPIVWPASHATGDVLFALFSVRGSFDPTGNSFATLTSNFDGLIVDQAASASTFNDLHTGVAYKAATSGSQADITMLDATGADTGNISSSAYVTVRNSTGTPTKLGADVVRQNGTAITHAGGTVAVGDMVMIVVSLALDGGVTADQLSGVSCAGVSGLTLARRAHTEATNRAVHSHVFTGIATQTSVGPFTATAAVPVAWNTAAIRIRK